MLSCCLPERISVLTNRKKASPGNLKTFPQKKKNINFPPPPLPKKRQFYKRHNLTLWNSNLQTFQSCYAIRCSSFYRQYHDRTIVAEDGCRARCRWRRTPLTASSDTSANSAASPTCTITIWSGTWRTFAVRSHASSVPTAITGAIGRKMCWNTCRRYIKASALSHWSFAEESTRKESSSLNCDSCCYFLDGRFWYFF